MKSPVVGRTYYVPLTDEVYIVRIIEKGDGGYNLKKRLSNPYLVIVLSGTDKNHELVVDQNELMTDALAASVKSSEMYEKAMRD